MLFPVQVKPQRAGQKVLIKQYYLFRKLLITTEETWKNRTCENCLKTNKQTKNIFPRINFSDT